MCNIMFSLNTTCIKFLNQLSDFLAFISMVVVTAAPISIIFVFFMWKRYQTSSIKSKNFIVNLIIDIIHLTLLINFGLIIEAIDHFEKIVKSKMQHSDKEFFFYIQPFFSLFLFSLKKYAFTHPKSKIKYTKNHLFSTTYFGGMKKIKIII